MHAYLEDHFQYDPFSDRECSPNTEVYLSQTYRPMSLDPDRVYQIRYLHAGKGQSLAGRWGHSMVLVIVCDEGTPLSEQCIGQTHNHVVVSYRGNVDDITTSIWKGLLGGYASIPFLFSYSEILKEYPLGHEDRELISGSLNLTEVDKKIKIYKMIEHYWSYQGKYYFLSQNCVHETGDVLFAGGFRSHQLRDAKRRRKIFPRSLLNELESSGLADFSDYQADRKEARKGLHYHPAGSEDLKLYWTRLKQKNGALDWPSFKDYVEEWSAEQRQSLFMAFLEQRFARVSSCLLYTSPSPRDRTRSRMPSSA